MVCAGRAEAFTPGHDAEVDRRVERLVDDGKYAEATQILDEELRALPEGPARRARRNLLAIQAANISRVAVPFDGCRAVLAGLRVADNYLRDFERAFGADGRQTDEFVGMSEIRERFAGLRGEHGCAEEGPAPPYGARESADAPDSKRARRTYPLPRVFVGLGVGTGVGLARGAAELTYRQYFPTSAEFTYGPAEFSCAVARWGAAGGALPSAARLQGALGMLPAAQYAPYDVMTLVTSYDQDSCGERQPVETAVASAPLHVAPEVGVRVTRALVISGFARLQVMTGSRVFRQDTSLAAAESYSKDIVSAEPRGVRARPGFTAAGGVKIKYFLGQDGRRFRGFVGGMIGVGSARLRAPLGFASDRNGNSVPDDQETAVDSDASNPCLPVWPYGDPTCGAGQSVALAGLVTKNTDSKQSVDTVRLGGWFVGGLVGFHYQAARRFALYAELGVSVWFPRTTSALVDLTLGPVLTF